MNVEFRRSFLKDMEKATESGVRQRVSDVIITVENAKALADVANVRKLHDGESYYRIRIGEYRIGLLCEGQTVVFVRFLHRKDIYRYFP